MTSFFRKVSATLAIITLPLWITLYFMLVMLYTMVAMAGLMIIGIGVALGNVWRK